MTHRHRVQGKALPLPFVIPRACDLFDLFVPFAHLTRFSTAPQNRHPERSASQIRRIKKGLGRGVEGPRRCLLADALLGFPPTNYEGNQKVTTSDRSVAEWRDLQFDGPVLEMFFTPRNGVILSEAPRRSIAKRTAYGAESKDPGDACWQMFFRAFRPQDYNRDHSSAAQPDSRIRFAYGTVSAVRISPIACGTRFLKITCGS